MIYKVRRFSMTTSLMKVGNVVAKNGYAKNMLLGAAATGGAKMVSNVVKGKNVTEGVGKAAVGGAAIGGVATAGTKLTANLTNRSAFGDSGMEALGKAKMKNNFDAQLASRGVNTKRTIDTIKKANTNEVGVVSNNATQLGKDINKGARDTAAAAKKAAQEAAAQQAQAQAQTTQTAEQKTASDTSTNLDRFFSDTLEDW